MVWGHNRFLLAVTEKNKQWDFWQRQKLSPKQLFCNELKETSASPITGKQLSNGVLSFLTLKPYQTHKV